MTDSKPVGKGSSPLAFVLAFLTECFLFYKKVVITINLKDKIFELRQQNTTWTKIDELLDLTPDQARNLARKDP